MNTPYLVQRMKSKPKFDKELGIDGNYRLTYMGSAEFEWGALPDSLRRITDNISDLSVTSTDITDSNNNRLNLVSTNEITLDYLDSLKKLSEGKHDFRTKEYVGLCDELDDHTWWDIQHDVFWTYSKENANNLIVAIHNVKKRFDND